MQEGQDEKVEIKVVMVGQWQILIVKFKGARSYLKPYSLQFCIVSCTQAMCKMNPYGTFN